MTIRVFHVPSHLKYAAKLVGTTFEPVSSPGGKALRVGELVARPSWDFFDVLHLHTVELASEDDLRELTARCASEGKRLVLTAHDLEPSIEQNRSRFAAKLRFVSGHADATVTLTTVAAKGLPAAPPCLVVPHGQAVPSRFLPPRSIGRGGGGVAVFGALRPNRDLPTLVGAHQSLGVDRPPLRILLRSVSQADERRYASVLSVLHQAADRDRRLNVTVRRDMIDDIELIAWLADASAVVLPYRRITHSGQLELARDLGLPVLAPAVSTLAAQLRNPAFAEHPVTWFGADDFTVDRFGPHLRAASQMAPPSTDKHKIFVAYRGFEHDQVLQAYEHAYGCVSSRQ